MATSETGPGELYRNVGQEVQQQTGGTGASSAVPVDPQQQPPQHHDEPEFMTPYATLGRQNGPSFGHEWIPQLGAPLSMQQTPQQNQLLHNQYGRPARIAPQPVQANTPALNPYSQATMMNFPMH